MSEKLDSRPLDSRPSRERVAFMYWIRCDGTEQAQRLVRSTPRFSRGMV